MRSPLSILPRRIATFAGVLLLAGCHFSLISPKPAPNLYDISTAPVFMAQMPSVSWQLEVGEPGASHELDTDRIVVRPNPLQVKYFADVRWTERSPRLVQSRLIEAFEKSGHIVGVAREGLGLHTDYKLISELRSFEVASGGDASHPRIHIVLNLQLVRESGSSILAARSFEESVAASDDSITDIARAFEAALNKVLANAIPWSLSVGEADYQLQANRSAKSH